MHHWHNAHSSHRSQRKHDVNERLVHLAECVADDETACATLYYQGQINTDWHSAHEKRFRTVGYCGCARTEGAFVAGTTSTNWRVLYCEVANPFDRWVFATVFGLSIYPLCTQPRMKVRQRGAEKHHRGRSY